jgi:hypothetical protein
MNKKLNTNAITNELEGSVFFSQKRASQKAAAPAAQTEPEKPKDGANSSLPERPNASSPVRPNGRRIITRNSFETYEDQMESLRKLSFHEKMQGKVGSMSQMVREAIDEYLAKRAHEI